MSTAPTPTAGTWVLDPSHTEVGFTVRHLMSKVRGRFDTFEGTVVTAEDVSQSTVSVTVDLASINTNNSDRDNHLRSGDFFDAESHPSMTFTSTSVAVVDAEHLTVTGDLTIKGTTRTVDLAVELLGEGADPWGGTRIGVEAKAEISRKEFGIDFNIPVGGDKVMIGDTIAIVIGAEAVLQEG